MKAAFFKVDSPERESFRYLRVRERNLGAVWHFHPEYQITLIVEGTGHRLVGDTFAPLTPGDLTLLGPNIPHFWHTDDPPGVAKSSSDAIIVQFAIDFLGADFFASPGMHAVSRLLERSTRGLAFPRATQRKLLPRMKRLIRVTAGARVVELLAILHDLASAPGTTAIATAGFLPQLDHVDHDRLQRVNTHIHQHLDEPIFRDDLARLAGMSPRTFSRYFRKKMGKTLPYFINELRIGRACRLLMEGNLTVSEVALNCGFENLANFNAQFRRIKGAAPREFRQQARVITEAGGKRRTPSGDKHR